jgi:hypothetical protein
VLTVRRGYTIVEMLVALGIGGCVIGLCASMGFRHQRFHRDVVAAVERTEQLEQILGLLPVSLRSISPADGDIRPGGARDTSLEFRATIGSAVTCDSVAGGAVLFPIADSLHLSSQLSRPEARDTIWLLAADSLAEHWNPFAITSVTDTIVACRLGSTFPLGDTPRPTMTIRWSGPGAPAGTALRLTRPWRYSLYKAADNAWYLGAKEWNSASGKFNTIQPVAGPLLSASSAGLRFVYYDSLGGVIPSGSAMTSGITLIEATINSDPVAPSKSRGAFVLRQRSVGAVALLDR